MNTNISGKKLIGENAVSRIKAISWNSALDLLKLAQSIDELSARLRALDPLELPYRLHIALWQLRQEAPQIFAALKFNEDFYSSNTIRWNTERSPQAHVQPGKILIPEWQLIEHMFKSIPAILSICCAIREVDINDLPLRIVLFLETWQRLQPKLYAAFGFTDSYLLQIQPYHGDAQEGEHASLVNQQ